MLRARTVNGATGVFCGPREHPNIFHGTRQHWLIFKPNFGGSECGNFINLLHPFLCTGRMQSLLSPAIAVFRCFINTQKDANERKLTQAGRENIAVYAPNLRYVYCT